MTDKHQPAGIRREYNKWIANETLEDYSLRYTAKKARRWSNARVANTALGIVSFLALEAIGATITLSYGFTNAFWAILIVGAIIFLCGIPISYYAARDGLDIDLLTRGAGFGYIGSTISSLIYASFTFIFFALEAAIMSMALHLATNIPLSLAYVVSALVVIPLVTHGISRISRFQAWTQPLWIVMQIVPLLVIASQESAVFEQWLQFDGIAQTAETGFSLYMFGACAAVIFPLIAQNAEQADFLRFLPEKKQRPFFWWSAVIGAGPGWILVGIPKLLLGSFLAVLALNHGLDAEKAADPAHMYTVAFQYLTNNPQAAIYIAAFFVVISQLKINVTNAYAGSIAWGNFFSRLTHSHPGRVVWLFFNVAIALLLMELGLYEAFEDILSTYAILVVAWIGCIVADLVINKPLGLRPAQMEFRRSHLYDINPVGVVSMLIASSCGMLLALGLFGEQLTVLAAFVSLLIPFVTVPLISVITKGKYYINSSRQNEMVDSQKLQGTCRVCDNTFDIEDISQCPVYEGDICSLCCSLDARCHDMCRPYAHLSAQAGNLFGKIIPGGISQQLHSATGSFFVIFLLTSTIIAALLGLVYEAIADKLVFAQRDLVSDVLWRVFFLLLLVIGVLVWLYVLARDSARLALGEIQSQANLLEQEILAHEETNQQLLQAKTASDNANQAKSRYLSGVTHELRTPLNTIYGYAQLMEANQGLDARSRQIAGVIKRSGQHLAEVIEGLLDISKIEARKLELYNNTLELKRLVNQLEEMFEPQAWAKNLSFGISLADNLPSFVSTDEKRLRQILFNLLSNAIKYTEEGSVELIIGYRNQVASFTVRDTGIGISADDQQRIFEPFERVRDNANMHITGTGLGLSISYLLADLMGGSITVSSTPGQGSEFCLKLLLPGLIGSYQKSPSVLNLRTQSSQKSIMIVDDEHSHRQMLHDLLEPVGFQLQQAESGPLALDLCKHQVFDLFILDINMPLMDGWALLQKLRSSGVRAPVIMLSANPLESEARVDMRDLYDLYVHKPVELEVLLSGIEQLLGIQITESALDAKSSHNTDKALDANAYDILHSMRDHAKIGYLKGLTDSLAHLEASYAGSTWFSHIKLLVESCDFDSLVSSINRLDGDEHAGA